MDTEDLDGVFEKILDIMRTRQGCEWPSIKWKELRKEGVGELQPLFETMTDDQLMNKFSYWRKKKDKRMEREKIDELFEGLIETTRVQQGCEWPVIKWNMLRQEGVGELQPLFENMTNKQLASKYSYWRKLKTSQKPLPTSRKREKETEMEHNQSTRGRMRFNASESREIKDQVDNFTNTNGRVQWKKLLEAGVSDRTVESLRGHYRRFKNRDVGTGKENDEPPPPAPTMPIPELPSNYYQKDWLHETLTVSMACNSDVMKLEDAFDMFLKKTRVLQAMIKTKMTRKGNINLTSYTACDRLWAHIRAKLLYEFAECGLSIILFGRKPSESLVRNFVQQILCDNAPSTIPQSLDGSVEPLIFMGLLLKLKSTASSAGFSNYEEFQEAACHEANVQQLPKLNLEDIMVHMAEKYHVKLHTSSSDKKLERKRDWFLLTSGGSHCHHDKFPKAIDWDGFQTSPVYKEYFQEMHKHQLAKKYFLHVDWREKLIQKLKLFS